MLMTLPLLSLAMIALWGQDDAGKAARERMVEIRKQLSSQDEKARLAAVAELGGIFEEEARSLLARRLVSDTDEIRIAAAKAIVRHKRAFCAAAIGNAFQANPGDKTAKAFIACLAELDMCASIPVLAKILQLKPALGDAVLQAIEKIGCLEACESLVGLLKGAETEERKPDQFRDTGLGGTGEPARATAQISNLFVDSHRFVVNRES